MFFVFLVSFLLKKDYISSFFEITAQSPNDYWLSITFIRFCKYKKYNSKWHFFALKFLVCIYTFKIITNIPDVCVFLVITWYKVEAAWTHALEDPHKKYQNSESVWEIKIIYRFCFKKITLWMTNAQYVKQPNTATLPWSCW